MNVLELVKWEHVSFQELDMLLRVSSCSDTVLVDKELSNHLTPLCLACKHNREDLVTVLLHHEARTDRCSSFLDKQPLHFACDHSNGNLGIVRKILDAKANVDAVDSDGNTGLHLACTESNVPVVELLIQHGANVNLTDIDGETPLVRACFAQSTTLVEMLLKASCNPNVPDGLPLEIAIRNHSIETLKVLLEAGADIHQGGYLCHASEHDHIEVMKILHNYGADVNKANVLGMSPLHTACFSHQASADAVQLLLQWGADVHAFSSTWETALHYACNSQSIVKIRLLLSYGANPNALDSHRLSPLMMAMKNLSQNADESRPDQGVIIIRLLLAAGARLKQESVESLKSMILLVRRAVAQRQELLDILDFHVSQPADLQSLCRVSIRKSLCSVIDENVKALPLPPQMIRYLNFYDIVK